jgi:hypothetical protein
MVMTEPTPEGRIVRRRERRSWMSAVPLLIIPLLAYVTFAGAGADFDASRFSIPLPSGGTWQLGLGPILLAIALGLLFFEILKATRGGGASITENALSMIVFAACLILFLIWDRAATSTFFLLTLMAMIDVIAAFAVTINAARRDHGAGGPA